MLQITNTRSAYIDKFVLYGERHSGTNFLEQCLKQRFGLEKTEYYGNKHFFGWTKPEIITYHKSSLHTLFIGIVRDPYDWIMANFKSPYHYDPERSRDINTFLLGEWYSVNPYGGIMSEDYNFITKKRYSNIFDMRTTKYKYLSETMPIIAYNYVLLSYDTWLKNYENYMNIISNRFCLKKIGTLPSLENKNPYLISPDIKSIIDSNVDWDLENSLGFSKRP
jgi:hypothetical protein